MSSSLFESNATQATLIFRSWALSGSLEWRAQTQGRVSLQGRRGQLQILSTSISRWNTNHSWVVIGLPNANHFCLPGDGSGWQYCSVQDKEAHSPEKADVYILRASWTCAAGDFYAPHLFQCAAIHFFLLDYSVLIWWNPHQWKWHSEGPWHGGIFQELHMDSELMLLRMETPLRFSNSSLVGVGVGGKVVPVAVFLSKVILPSGVQ